MGPSIGVLFAHGPIALLTSVLGDAVLLDWGWRLPLLASVILVRSACGCGSASRRHRSSAHWNGHGALARTARRGGRDHWRGLLMAGGSRFGPDVMYSLISAFLLAYITRELMLGRPLATMALAIGSAATPFASSSRVGCRIASPTRGVYGAGCHSRVSVAACLFPLLHLRTELAVAAAIVSGLIIHAFMYGPQGAFIANSFPRACATQDRRLRTPSRRYLRADRSARDDGPVPKIRHDDVIVMYAATALLITITALAFAPPDRDN
jgi:hypothetical protein